MNRNESSRAITRRSFMQTALGVATYCLPQAVFAQYETKANQEGNDVVLRFSALSDVHFKVSPNTPEVDRFRRSFRFMYDYSAKQPYPKFDAVLIAGDFTDHGLDDELLLFRKIMNEEIKADTQTLLCMGNHEFIEGTKERWEELFQRDSNKGYEVNGFHFIALSPERGTNKNGDFMYALDWYKKELDKATAADPKRPIFTFQHYHITPTVYGSRGEDNWGIADLYDVLQRYPRVINFSGHSHYPINDPRSVWQGNFTAFGTGTLSYFEMGGEGGRYPKFPEGFHNAAQLYVVEVRKDNSVILKPYDLISNSFFDVVYVVAEPGAVDKYLYTDARYVTSSAPEWKDDAKVETPTFIDDELVVLKFPQATCKDVVHSYRIDLEERVEADGKTEWRSIDSRYFWSEYYFKNRPETMTITLDDLKETTTYRAKIVALSAFFKESSKALEVAFTTPKNPQETVDKNAPKPDANFLDVQFEDGKPVNRPVNNFPTQRKVQGFGAPSIVADPALKNTQVASFNGKDQFFKVQFDDRSYRRISAAASFAVDFKFTEFENAIEDIFSNTESAGICFELNAEKKSLEFWASVNGKYRILSVPIEPSERYFSAFGTYDGKRLVMYLNGREVASLDAPGKITYPKEQSVQAFCIGSDIAPGGAGGAFFKGFVARARAFTWALTAEQVAALCE